ncbi:MAG: LysM peptidoglycan-binding domain-containing protein [Bacteroidia bacterium]|nr:LysM peptidoglycan-binding domain-containing protein [Bacteroidia bacterium]
MKTLINLIVLILFLAVNTFAINPPAKKYKYSDTTFVFKNDDPIVAALDSLKYLKLWETSATPDIAKLNIYNYRTDEVPTFDDLVYEARLAKLDAASPIHLDYHPSVRPYIDMYMFRRRSQVSRLLGLSKMYFPMFEQVLDKYNLPLELKNLAVIESALNPMAQSHCGATGLWQFMYGTGKMFNLDVTSYVDERRDPIKATEAACKYFQYLYNMFGDWQLVLASYNAGPGTVNRAIRRSGGKRTYWEIRPFLPVETQGYVPGFIAATYVMNYSAEHNLYPIIPGPEYFQIETVKTAQQVSFQQLSQGLGIPVEELRYLNPSYKQNIIPFTEDGSNLVLPHNKIGAFDNNEQAIYNYKTPEEKIREEQADISKLLTYKDVGRVHKVHKGDNLKSIAKRYGVSVAELKEWNRKATKGGKLKAGTRITYYVKVPVYMAQNKKTPSQPQAAKDSTEVAIVDAKMLEQEPKTTNAKEEVAVEEDEVQEETKKVTKLSAKETKKQLAEKKEVKTKEKETTNNKTKTIVYKVHRGDTLWSIAKNYPGTTVQEIKKWNNIRSNNGLKVGMKVKIVLNS